MTPSMSAPQAPTLAMQPPAAQLAAALVVAQGAVEEAAKDGRNPDDGYTYATADELVRVGKAALKSAGLALLPVSTDIVPCQSGGVDLVRGFLLLHGSGASMPLTVRWPVPGDKARDKAAASAYTSSLGYVMRDLLAIPRVMAGEEPMDARKERRSEPAPKPEESDGGPVRTELLAPGYRKGTRVWTWAEIHEEVRRESGQRDPNTLVQTTGTVDIDGVTYYRARWETARKTPWGSVSWLAWRTSTLEPAEFHARRWTKVSGDWPAHPDDPEPEQDTRSMEEVMGGETLPDLAPATNNQGPPASLQAAADGTRPDSSVESGANKEAASSLSPGGTATPRSTGATPVGPTNTPQRDASEDEARDAKDSSTPFPLGLPSIDVLALKPGQRVTIKRSSGAHQEATVVQTHRASLYAAPETGRDVDLVEVTFPDHEKRGGVMATRCCAAEDIVTVGDAPAASDDAEDRCPDCDTLVPADAPHCPTCGPYDEKHGGGFVGVGDDDGPKSAGYYDADANERVDCSGGCGLLVRKGAGWCSGCLPRTQSSGGADPLAYFEAEPLKQPTEAALVRAEEAARDLRRKERRESAPVTPHMGGEESGKRRDEEARQWREARAEEAAQAVVAAAAPAPASVVTVSIEVKTAHRRLKRPCAVCQKPIEKGSYTEVGKAAMHLGCDRRGE